MGTTSKFYRTSTHQEFGKKELIDFLSNESDYYGFEFLKIAFQQNPKDDWHIVYAVIRNIASMKCFILVIKIMIQNNEIYWKEIEESMGPVFTDCPEEFFKYWS